MSDYDMAITNDLLYVRPLQWLAEVDVQTFPILPFSLRPLFFNEEDRYRFFMKKTGIVPL
jgi:hypothetical protein